MEKATWPAFPDGFGTRVPDRLRRDLPGYRWAIPPEKPDLGRTHLLHRRSNVHSRCTSTVDIRMNRQVRAAGQQFGDNVGSSFPAHRTGAAYDPVRYRRHAFLWRVISPGSPRSSPAGPWCPGGSSPSIPRSCSPSSRSTTGMWVGCAYGTPPRLGVRAGCTSTRPPKSLYSATPCSRAGWPGSTRTRLVPRSPAGPRPSPSSPPWPPWSRLLLALLAECSSSPPSQVARSSGSGPTTGFTHLTTRSLPPASVITRMESWYSATTN